MHAHSAALARALKALTEISNDDVSQRRSIDNASITSSSWLYHGSASNVHIYSKSAQSFPELPRGDQADSMLPFFRGESVIDGEWRIDDVLATIASVGARSIWDQRFKSSSSSVVALLSDTDVLLHTFVGANFPVGDRDSVQACSVIKKSISSGMYISCSVEDPAVPLGDVLRNHVSLSGWVLRYKDMDEEDLAIPETVAEEQPLSTKNHSKTLSRHFEPLAHTMPTLSRRSVLPQGIDMTLPSSRPQISHRQSQSLIETYGGHSMRHRGQLSKDVGDVMDLRKSTKTAGKTKGIKTTFVLRTNPGGNLPASFINQLNTQVPLCIAFLNKYLKTYGFAPHLVDRRWITILSETFDPTSSYCIIIRIEKDRPAEMPVELRFMGLGFSEGRFEVKVSGTDKWDIRYDYSEHGDSRTSVTTLADSKIDAPSMRPRFSQRFSHPAMKDEPDLPPDPSKLRGAQGGCTLSISAPFPDTKLIQINISKKPRNQSETMSDIAKIGALLTEANRRAALKIDELEEEERYDRLNLEVGEKELRRANAVATAMRSVLKSATEKT